MTIWEGAKWQRFICPCNYSWLRPIGFSSKETCPACKKVQCEGIPYSK